MKKAAIILVLFLSAVPVNAQQTNKLLSAPDIVPPATEAMQHPEFWISRIDNPDRVIMTLEQIREFNGKNRIRPLQAKDINGATVAIDSVLTQWPFADIRFHLDDPLAIMTWPGGKVREQLGRLREYLMESTLWDRRQIPFPDERKREIISAMNAEAVPETIHPRFGITTKHTLNRVVPTSVKVNGSQYGWLDMFQNAVLETGMPVAILHESREGDWVYVRSEYSTGWVPAANVAEGNPQEIGRLARSRNFVVAIAHKVPVYSDSKCTRWLTDIYMGGKLGLNKKTDSGYSVVVPYRMQDGFLRRIEGWIRPDAPVSVGYQQYTQRNVITTAFRLLGRPYGWGGTDHERDCVGTLRAVFKTFGIFMPRWTTYELYYTDHAISFPADTPKDVKYRYLDSCEPGITIYGFDWHVVLYLGKADGGHYIIHQNGYSYHDADGVENRVARVSVNSTELEGGGDIGRYTVLAPYKP